MAVTTLDGLVAALTAGETRNFMKTPTTTEGAGFFHSLWRAPGMPGAAGTPPTSAGEIPTDATAGSFPFVNAAGAANNYLGYIAAASTVAGTLVLYDRLWHNSGLVGNVATLQSFTQPSLTRYTSGEGVELWGEVYSPMGATAATFTAIYTDQGGTGSNSATYVMPANALAQDQMFPFTLASGDYGVRDVDSVQLSISTGTAGNFGLLLMKRLVTIPLQTQNVAAVYDAFSSGLREVADDACLAFMIQCSATNQGVIGGELTVAKG